MLTAGFAQASITPPVGVEISGYAFGPSACVLEELQAQAVVLESGDARAAIISADVYEADDYTGPNGLAPKVYAVHGFDKQAEPICRKHND